MAVLGDGGPRDAFRGVAIFSLTPDILGPAFFFFAHLEYPPGDGVPGWQSRDPA